MPVAASQIVSSFCTLSPEKTFAGASKKAEGPGLSRRSAARIGEKIGANGDEI
jgi:hypothetical protein